MKAKFKLIILGSMGESPFAGMAWEVLHYLEGFLRLGHDVYYVEDTGMWPYDPANSEDAPYAVQFISRTMKWYGMPDRWAYRASERQGRVYGMSESRFKRLFEEADALVNVTASTVLRDEHLKVPVRVYLQTDPGLKEIQSAKGDTFTLKLIQDHTHWFTFAENLGAADCGLPAGPVPYRLTRQPIVLDWFTPSHQVAGNGSYATSSPLRFTTVGNWKQTEADIEWNGKTYRWSKHYEFLKFIDLPRRIGCPIELALASIDEPSREMLASYGWKTTDAISLTTDILPYRDYILESDGEFTVAKDQNIRLRTGWFSERSASYLAAGKPVITQDTGFGKVLPTGNGLFAFDSMEDILAGFEAVRSNYAMHSRAAHAIAEEYFRAETVLERLVEEL